MMTSNSDPIAAVGYAQRWSKQHRQFINVQQPDVNKVHNATMGGVDQADQNTAESIRSP